MNKYEPAFTGNLIYKPESIINHSSMMELEHKKSSEEMALKCLLMLDTLLERQGIIEQKTKN